MLQQQTKASTKQQRIPAELSNSFTRTTARAEAAERERAQITEIASKLARGSATDLVDGKGVGQPFKLTGKKQGHHQDFSEWDHKFRIYAPIKFGRERGDVPSWAKKQRKQIVARVSDARKHVSFEDEWGDGADELNRIDDFEHKPTALYAYLASFVPGGANKGVRNSGDGQGLEAWRRLHNEYNPSSSMRRVTILGHVQNLPKCQKIDDLGQALEDWLSKKRQYEDFTDREGNPCEVSKDSLMGYVQAHATKPGGNGHVQVRGLRELRGIV